MKQDALTPVVDRREWLTSLARGGALAGIGLLVAHRATQRAPAGCTQWASQCGSCRLLSQCEVPQAGQARAEQARKERT